MGEGMSMRSRMIAVGAYGFTLIEMMIAVAVSAGVSAAAFSIYNVQQRSYLRQEQIVEMQQNGRAFLYFIEKDLRIAGYNPLKIARSGFVTAKPYEIVFTADLGRSRSPAVNCTGVGCDSIPDGFINCGSGCTGISNYIDTSACPNCVVETMRYSLKPASVQDFYTSGSQTGQVKDTTKTTSVQKTFNGTTSTGAQDVADSVQGLEFLYNMNDGTSVTDVLAAGKNLADIRSVTVSLLMRTANHLAGYWQPVDPADLARGDKHSYQYPASNAGKSSSGNRWGPFTDNYMRRMIITNIQCRNMALQPPEF